MIAWREIHAHMNARIGTNITLAAAVALAALGITSLFWSFDRVDDAAQSRRQNRAMVSDAAEVMSFVNEAEVGQRGYLLTGDESLLAPYMAARDSVARRLAALRQRSTDVASQRQLDALALLIDGRLEQMSRLVALRRDGKVADAQAPMRSGSGEQLMDSIRITVRDFVRLETAALDRREGLFDRDVRRLFISIVVASLLVLLLALALVFLMRQRAGQQLRSLVHVETAHLLTAQQEISARLQQANLTLAESEEQLDVTLGSIGDAVLTTNADARVLRLNAVAERLTGWTMAQAVGRPVAEVFRIVNKEDRHPATIPVTATLAHGTIQGLANHTVLIARDGRECDIADSCAPIRDRAGLVIGAVLVFRDVTAEYAVQQSLNDSAALIETVLDTVADGIITFRADDHTVAKVNPAAERIFGFSSDEMLGTDFRLLVPELEGDGLDASLAQFKPRDEARASGLGREVMGRCKSGGAVPLEIAVSDMRLGGQRYFTGIVRDITARKQVEAALREAGALQHAIFNSANFSSIATDANGVIQIFNVGAERMLGYAAEDVLDKITPADISDPDEVIVRARSLSIELSTPISPGFEALVFKASRGIEDIYELTYVRKDGSRFPAVVSVTALRDEHDSIIGYLLIGTDNTARKQVETDQKKLDQRLRDQQFYTRSLIESNIDALMTTDPAGIITDVNSQTEALTGCTRDELIGAPFKGYFTEPERADAAIQLVLRDKKVSDFELTARSRDGVRTVVSFNATTFYDRDRTLQGVFASARDVTERKRVEVELQKAKSAAESASRTKSDFLASMSHEIRTPMNALMGIADLLARTPLSAEQDKYVQIFRRAGDNLLNLINDILDLSKVEASQLELEMMGFSLDELLDKVMEMITPQTEEKGLTLERDIDPDVPRALVGDPTRLRQVLLNLLGNAIKFTESGTVTLKVTRDDNLAVPTALRFAVFDTGIGIASEKLPRVFERFTQADSSTTRRFGGSGLGLTISKRLVELMEGGIGVDSQAGGGSVFWFTIRAGLGSSKPKPRVLRPDVGGRRVLVVDDNDSARIVMRDMLAAMSFDVSVSASGEEAVAAVRLADAAKNPYAIVYLDWRMPGMDGMAVARAIGALGLAARPHVVMVTAYGREELITEASEVGIEDFLMKPVSASVLFNASVQLLQGDRLPSSPVPAGMAPVRSRRARILVVEDNELNQEVARDMLEQLGHRVDVAANGQAALRMAQQSAYDLVFMDMQMPVMDGIDATQAIRRLPEARFAAVPIVAMTANVMRQDQARCLAAGMNDYIPKPIDPAALDRMLERWLPSGVWGESSPAATPGEAPDEAVPLDIPGLDAAQGLSRVLGNAPRYRSLLRRFANQERDCALAIRAHLARGEREDAERRAHTVKGAAATLGAVDLQADAMALELAIRELRPGGVMDERLAAFDKRLGNLVAALDARYPAPAGAEPR